MERTQTTEELNAKLASKFILKSELSVEEWVKNEIKNPTNPFFSEIFRKDDSGYPIYLYFANSANWGNGGDTGSYCTADLELAVRSANRSSERHKLNPDYYEVGWESDNIIRLSLKVPRVSFIKELINSLVKNKTDEFMFYIKEEKFKAELEDKMNMVSEWASNAAYDRGLNRWKFGYHNAAKAAALRLIRGESETDVKNKYIKNPEEFGDAFIFYGDSETQLNNRSL